MSVANTWILHFSFTLLPTGFFYSGNLAGRSQFSETNAAQIELAHVSVLSSAFPTAPDYSG
jgi:hypothetical protein